MAEQPAVKFLPLGAIIKEIKVGGKNIVLGFSKEDEYIEHNTPYFGETIGRVANRIQGAKLKAINGKSYTLAANNGQNTLHGGVKGWGKRRWEGPRPVGRRDVPGISMLEGGDSVEFRLVSHDGDEGFPGTVEARIIYTTGLQHVDGRKVTVLAMDYEAHLTGGADETVVNMTNHSYFNLSGGDTIDGTTVTLATNQHLPVDDESIPIGGPYPHPDIKYNEPLELGSVGPSIDNCFTHSTSPTGVPLDTRREPLLWNVTAFHKGSGVCLEVLSTEPAFQFYTGDYIDVPPVGNAPARGKRSGFCIEPGRWVNACNEPLWRSQVLLKRGQTYGCRTVYRAWVN